MPLFHFYFHWIIFSFNNSCPILIYIWNSFNLCFVCALLFWCNINNIRYSLSKVAIVVEEKKQKRKIKVGLGWCYCCLNETLIGSRPNGYFNKIGQKNFIVNFYYMTGSYYEQKQLKNMWDILKKKLATSDKFIEKWNWLRWEPVKQTIIARDQWWERKLKV